MKENNYDIVKDTEEHIMKGVSMDVIEPVKFEIFDINEGVKTYLGGEELAGPNPAVVVEFPAGYQIPFSFTRFKLHQGFILVRG